jgi:hypothetical protein
MTPKICLRYTIAPAQGIAIHPVSKLTRVIASLRQLNMNKTTAMIFAVIGSVNGFTAHAQNSAASASASPLSPIYACADKTDPAQRLACFDAAVAAVKAAEARNEIVTMDQPRVAAVRREAFGFRIPSLPRFGLGGSSTSTPNAAGSNQAARPAQEEQIDEQTFTVVRVGAWGDRIAFYLENGNVWHTVEAGELNTSRKTPFNVRIRSASLGSFILSIEGRNRGYRVRRIE